jgi:hypothetical protein
MDGSDGCKLKKQNQKTTFYSLLSGCCELQLIIPYLLIPTHPHQFQFQFQYPKTHSPQPSHNVPHVQRLAKLPHHTSQPLLPSSISCDTRTSRQASRPNHRPRSRPHDRPGPTLPERVNAMIAWLERAKQGPPLRFGTGIGRWDECTEVYVCGRFWGVGGCTSLLTAS